MDMCGVAMAGADGGGGGVCAAGSGQQDDGSSSRVMMFYRKKVLTNAWRKPNSERDEVRED